MLITFAIALAFISASSKAWAVPLKCRSASFLYAVLETQMKCPSGCLDLTSYDPQGRRKCDPDYLNRLCREGTHQEPISLCDPIVMLNKSSHQNCLKYGQAVPWIFSWEGSNPNYQHQYYFERYPAKQMFSRYPQPMKPIEGVQKFMQVYDKSGPEHCANMFVQILDRDEPTFLKQSIGSAFYKLYDVISEPMKVSLLNADTPFEVGHVLQVTHRVPMKLKCGAGIPVMVVKFAVYFRQLTLENGTELCAHDLWNCSTPDAPFNGDTQAREAFMNETIQQMNRMIGVCECCKEVGIQRVDYSYTHEPRYYTDDLSPIVVHDIWRKKYPDLAKQEKYDLEKCGS